MTQQERCRQLQQGDVYVHGTAWRKAEQILKEGVLRAWQDGVWAAPASAGGREMALFYGREQAAPTGDRVALIYFQTESVPDEMGCLTAATGFSEWEVCWLERLLPVSVLRVELLEAVA